MVTSMFHKDVLIAVAAAADGYGLFMVVLRLTLFLRLIVLIVEVVYVEVISGQLGLSSDDGGAADEQAEGSSCANLENQILKWFNLRENSIVPTYF